MTLYARHLAWLSATPEGSTQSRREEFEKGGVGSPFLVLPDVTGAEYIVQLWHNAGTIESTGMGVTRLTWKEIDSWLNVRERTGEAPLLDYEVALIRDMSEAYSSEYSQASDKTHPAPYFSDNIEDSVDRSAVSKKIGNLFKSFGKSDTGPRYTIDN